MLRDAILHLFADDPTLEPRDVIVMCPDIETFAPLIQATFGAGDDLVDGESSAGGVPSMRVRLADRAVRQTNPVLAALADLLELASARVTASQLVDFISLEPVRRRFRLDDDELTRVEEWVGSTGIRWGLDAAHRAPFKLDGFDANTWRAGTDRVLLGVTMTEDEQPIVGGVLPLDDVDSGDIALAGRLAELVERVRSTIDALTGPQPVTSWARAIAGAADTLLAGSPREAWQRAELDRLLQDIVVEVRRRGGDRDLAAGTARAARRSPPRPTRPGQLPDRSPHGVHAGAHAIGPASRHLPPGPRRRFVPPTRRSGQRRHHGARAGGR